MAQGILRFAEGRSDLLRIDPRKVRWTPGIGGRDFETPENQRHLEETTLSVIAHGVRNPITVRVSAAQGEDEALWLVDGEVRLRAALDAIERGAAIKTIPAIAEERGKGDADRIVDQITRNTGKRFEPIELGRLCKRLESYGWKRKDIADALAMSTSNVSHVLALLEMPEQVQDMVRHGDVAPATALRTIRAEGIEAGTDILQSAITDAAAAIPLTLPTEGDAPAKAKKVTGKSIEKTKAKRDGITPSPKPKARGQNMGQLYDALFTQINKFLGKCIDGTYEKYDGDTVPDRLVSDATAMAETIKATRAGFKDTEAEAAE